MRYLLKKKVLFVLIITPSILPILQFQHLINKKYFTICLQSIPFLHLGISRVSETQVSGNRSTSLLEFGSSSGEKNAPLEPSEKTAHPQKVFLRKTLSQKIAFYSCRKRAPFILASKVPAKRSH